MSRDQFDKSIDGVSYVVLDNMYWQSRVSTATESHGRALMLLSDGAVRYGARTPDRAEVLVSALSLGSSFFDDSVLRGASHMIE